jgi:predicted negative regulator of RcsB-dependent stress response
VPEPEDVLDEELMLALAQAKNFHHKAKVYMSDGNLAEAAAQMQAILAIAFPPAAPEGDDVRLDARAMLAKLLVAQGKIDEAMTVVDQGIGGARRDSFFLANLYTVKGEVHHARAAVLEDQGEAVKQRVVDEKRAAILAFERSIQIDVALQKQLVEDRARRQREGEE